MTILYDGENLEIGDIEELALANSASVSRQLLEALPVGVKRVFIDLCLTSYMDCAGLGALVSLRKAALTKHNGTELRILNAPSQIRQMFELTKMDHLFQFKH